jgi:2'-5' RNA ligase
LALFVPAHVTVVFPFVSTELPENEIVKVVVDAAAQFGPMETAALRCSFEPDGAIQLLLLDAENAVQKLHSTMYSGILKSFLDPRLPYRPHMTIGRYTTHSRCGCEEAVARLTLPVKIRLRRVVLEEILDSEESRLIRNIVVSGVEFHQVGETAGLTAGV